LLDGRLIYLPGLLYHDDAPKGSVRSETFKSLNAAFCAAS
jgi:hypothetical protein